MKRLILFLAVAVLFAACDDKDKGNGKLDPNAMISLRAAPSGRAAASPNHLSALEIVKQTMEIEFINEDKFPDTKRLSREFGDNQRDLANERLLMYGSDIITPRGEWLDDFIGGSNVVLTRAAPADAQYPDGHIDTIAYIKNATLREARILAKAAFDREDYKTVYELFDQAFTFIPITGEEWRELKAQGLN